MSPDVASCRLVILLGWNAATAIVSLLDLASRAPVAAAQAARVQRRTSLACNVCRDTVRARRRLSQHENAGRQTPWV